ncbi:MAG: type II toxin-antitoxin system ParD family antitoxin [Phycisphaerae bacterium]
MNARNGDIVSVPLKQHTKRFIENSVAAGAAVSVKAFVEDAIQEKCARERAKAKLIGLLQAGLDSGEPVPFDENYISRMKRRVARTLRRIQPR